jgi:hypothetical protein
LFVRSRKYPQKNTDNLLISRPEHQILYAVTFQGIRFFSFGEEIESPDWGFSDVLFEITNLTGCIHPGLRRKPGAFLFTKPFMQLRYNCTTE